MFQTGRLKSAVAKLVAIGSTGRRMMTPLLPEKIACIVVNSSPQPSPPEAFMFPVTKSVNEPRSGGTLWYATGPWRSTFKRLHEKGGEFAYACNPRDGWPHSWMLENIWTYTLAVKALGGAKETICRKVPTWLPFGMWLCVLLECPICA